MYLNKYINVSNNVELFLSYKRSFLIKKYETKYSLNDDGAILVREFDGRKTLEEIIKNILKRDINNIRDEEMNYINSFLTHLEKFGFVEFSALPKYRTFNIKGNLDTVIPLIVTLELTNKCNFKCRYCYNDCEIDNDRFISNPLEILKYLHRIGSHGIELSGGEPFLHPRISEILEYLVDHFDIFAILTNGALIKKQHLDILKRKSENKRIAIQICLDGSNEENVDLTAGVKGAFKNIINAIKLVKYYSLPLRVGMVIDHPDKINDIESTLLLSRELGADLFIASPMYDIGRGQVMATNFTKNDNMRLLKEIYRLHKKYKGFFQTMKERLSIENTENCGAGSKNIAIDWDGIIHPCPVANYNLNLGKWNEILTDKTQYKMKKFVSLNHPDIKECEGCKYLLYCSGCTTKGILKFIKLKEKCLWYQKNQKILDDLLEINL